MISNKNTFERHFRIYFRNGHPAYIVDEEGNKYIFHRVTHSKTSGGKKNWKNPKINHNPIAKSTQDETLCISILRKFLIALTIVLVDKTVIMTIMEVIMGPSAKM